MWAWRDHLVRNRLRSHCAGWTFSNALIWLLFDFGSSSSIISRFDTFLVQSCSGTEMPAITEIKRLWGWLWQKFSSFQNLLTKIGQLWILLCASFLCLKLSHSETGTAPWKSKYYILGHSETLAVHYDRIETLAKSKIGARASKYAFVMLASADNLWVHLCSKSQFHGSVYIYVCASRLRSVQKTITQRVSGSRRVEKRELGSDN